MTNTPQATTPAEQVLPTVSVVIPVRPGGTAEKAVVGVRNLDYPQDRIEIILAEGSVPSRQRNLAVQEARGELIFFLDNDSVPRSDWLHRALDALALDPQSAGVGGPNVTPDSDDFWQRLYGCALASKFAHSDMAYRYRPQGKLREAGQKELILCGMAVKRDAFLALKGFDESLFPNEENEFMNRVVWNGYKLYYHPEAIVERSRRRNLVQFFRQMMKYGRGRMEQTFVEQFHLANATFMAPLGLTVYVLAFPLYPRLFTALPLLVYWLGGSISAIGFARQYKEPLYAFLLPPVYLVMHMAYSCGLVLGFLRRTVFTSSHQPAAEPIVRRIQSFGTPWNDSITN